MKTCSEYSRKAFLINMAVVVCVSLLAYANTLYNGFVYDDNAQVVSNRWIRDISSIPDIFTSSAWAFLYERQEVNYFRPVMHLVYMADYHLFGLAPWGFHLANALIHSANAVMVFFTASLLMRSAVPGDEKGLTPLAAALLFSVHPANTEAVAWVAGVPELTYTLALLMAFYLYATDEGKRPGSPRYLLSVLFFFISTLSKETSFALIPIIVSYDILLRKDRFGLHSIKRYLPYIIAAAVYLALRLNALKGFAPKVSHQELNQLQYVLNIFPLFGKYILTLFAPVNLNALHQLDPVLGLLDSRLIASAAFAAAYGAAIFLLRRRSPLFSFLLVWLAVPLLPVLYIPFVGENTFAERYLYSPSIAFGAFVSLSLFKAAGRWFKKAAAPFIAVIAVLTVAMFAGTVSRNTVWRDDYSLWSDTAIKSPGFPLIDYYLGYSYYKMGMLDKAIEEYRIAVTKVRGNANLYHDYALACLQKGLLDEAIANYGLALSAGLTENEILHHDLGMAYHQKGLFEDAVRHYREAIRLGLSNDPSTRTLLGDAYAETGAFDLAASEYRESLRLDPSNQNVRRALESVLTIPR